MYLHEMQVSLRANQKARTRRALVEAARALMRRGAPPTVAEAAAAAGVSRASAYRYFPTQESLHLEISSVSPLADPVEKQVEAMAGGDAEARLLELLDAFNPIVLAEEASMRTALRAYRDAWLAARGAGGEPPAPVREGRRMRWLDKALEPARGRLTPAQLRRLRAALALTLSIEGVVVMKDVCRVRDDAEALGVLRWAARALLRAGLAEGRTAARPAPRRARARRA
jgi:AcrR family transcriptional regulator